ncbi:unnamed protein product [Cylicocyclus nassatus]|uniref:Uncharacterized protein n=1 Tax=Cylicocyclus nassatus TaxID=53992 RepID=A0AA36GLB0_CYLNA|nr:unnamed protein product [Cylicocyclus nassatus]
MEGVRVKIVDLFSCIGIIDGEFLVFNEEKIHKILRERRPKKPRAFGSRQSHLEDTNVPLAKRRYSPPQPRATKPPPLKVTSSSSTQPGSGNIASTSRTDDEVERIVKMSQPLL